MDILFSVLEFAASYNSYSNLRLRMRQIPAERLASFAMLFPQIQFSPLFKTNIFQIASKLCLIYLIVAQATI